MHITESEIGYMGVPNFFFVLLLHVLHILLMWVITACARELAQVDGQLG